MPQKTKVDSGTDELLAETRGRVAVLTLNRPESRNAVSKNLSSALGKLLRQFDKDPQIGSILLTGAGGAFCAGGDVKNMAKTAMADLTFEDRVADLRASQQMVWGALIAVRKPTIAAIPGAAAGAGLALALACDLRIAAGSAVFITAYARVALSGDCGIAWLLTRLVGMSRARELMFLSERIDMQRAEKLGLVNRVVPAGELQDNSLALAALLAEGPTFAYGLMKDNLDHALTAKFQESMDFEAKNLIRTELSADHQEGVCALAEKRKPNFNST